MGGKWRGGVGVGESCGEASRRDIVLSATSKCWYGPPRRQWVKLLTAHSNICFISRRLILVKHCVGPSWEMFEEHLCKELAGCGNKAVDNNLRSSSVYYHQRCRLGSQMALLPVHKPKATGCEREVHLYDKHQSYLTSRLTRGRFRSAFCFSFMRFCSPFAQKYNVSCYKNV